MEKFIQNLSYKVDWLHLSLNKSIDDNGEVLVNHRVELENLRREIHTLEDVFVDLRQDVDRIKKLMGI